MPAIDKSPAKADAWFVVKDDYKIPIVTACGGLTFRKEQPTRVPAKSVWEARVADSLVEVDPPADATPVAPAKTAAVKIVGESGETDGEPEGEQVGGFESGETDPDEGRCEGVTAAGNRCKRKAVEGERFCSIHIEG